MSTMVAIPVWQEQVSTTFDFAEQLLVVETEGRRELARRTVPLSEESLAGRARRIRDLAVEVVLCGAISQPLAQAIVQSGIRVIPHVSGPVDDVLAAYLCGQLTAPRFLQPGCRPGARRRWRHQSGFCGRNQQQ